MLSKPTFGGGSPLPQSTQGYLQANLLGHDVSTKGDRTRQAYEEIHLKRFRIYFPAHPATSRPPTPRNSFGCTLPPPVHNGTWSSILQYSNQPAKLSKLVIYQHRRPHSTGRCTYINPKRGERPQ